MSDVRAEPIGRLVQQHPAWVAVLEEFGIDGRGGATHTLLAATERAGVDIELVVAALSGPPRALVDCERLDHVSLRALIDHVEEVHHRRTRDLLVQLHRCTARDPEAAEAVAALAALLEAHLVTEEHLLFPLCRDLLDAFSWPSFHTGPVGRTLDDVHHDHGALDDAVTEVAAALADHECAPELLAELRSDLARHLDEEEHLLLPAVRRLAAELSVG